MKIGIVGAGSIDGRLARLLAGFDPGTAVAAGTDAGDATATLLTTGRLEAWSGLRSMRSARRWRW